MVGFYGPSALLQSQSNHSKMSVGANHNLGSMISLQRQTAHHNCYCQIDPSSSYKPPDPMFVSFTAHINECGGTKGHTIILVSSLGSGERGAFLSSCSLELNFPALGFEAFTPFLLAYISASSG